MSPLFAAVRRAALLCLPSAAIFAAGIILSPYADAQYPGGGGYPGGPAPGWSAVPRDGTTGQYPSDFDWMGLDVTRTVDPFPSSNMPPINSVQNHTNGNPSYGGWNSGGYPIEYTFQGTGGTRSSADDASLSITGSMEFHWLWTPGINPATNQSDLSLFPMPPLFVLGKGFVSMSRMLEYGTTGAGLSIIGTDKDGFGGSWSFSSALNDVQPPPGTPPGRGVLTASPVDATHKKASVSPSIQIDTRGTLPGDTSAELASASAAALPITLSAPDPFGRPDLGDGKNQYVYETSQPNGQLTVPASVYVPGASTDDTTWLLPHVTLSVSPAMQTGAQPFTWTASGAGLYVNTTGPRPGYTTGWPSGDFCYVGLPPNNSYFGSHVMTMNVDGQQSQTANYQLFYTATASNWPSSDTTTPDWYFYYNQVYQSTGSYKPGNVSYYDPASNQIYIGDVGHGNWSMRVFDLDAQNHVHYSGILYIGGIHTFIYVWS